MNHESMSLPPAKQGYQDPPLFLFPTVSVKDSFQKNLHIIWRFLKIWFKRHKWIGTFGWNQLIKYKNMNK